MISIFSTKTSPKRAFTQWWGWVGLSFHFMPRNIETVFKTLCCVFRPGLNELCNIDTALALVLNQFCWTFSRKNERTEDIESEDGEEEEDEDDDEALDAATELMYRWTIFFTKLNIFLCVRPVLFSNRVLVTKHQLYISTSVLVLLTLSAFSLVFTFFASIVQMFHLIFDQFISHQNDDTFYFPF